MITLAKNYTAFGDVSLTVGTGSSRYGYTGEQTETWGGIYLRARYYDPYLNQFIQPDPILPDSRVPGGWNRYVYSRNNPVNLTDPSGKTPCLFSDEMPLCYSKLAELKDYATQIKGQVTSGMSPVEGFASFIDRAYLLFDRDLQGMMWGTTNVLLGVNPNEYLMVWAPIVWNAYTKKGNEYFIGQDWLLYEHKNDPSLDKNGIPNSLQGDWKDEYWDETPNQAYHFWFYVETTFHDGPEWAATANLTHDGDWRNLVGLSDGVSKQDYDLASKGIEFGWNLINSNNISNMIGSIGCRENSRLPTINPGAWIRANLKR